VELRELPEPSAFDHQALVQVKAVSLNRGETRRLADMGDGELTGWDLAGVVVEPARDGSGPRAGARVVGMVGRGAWAQHVAVDTDMLSELPEGVSFEQAATLPVAGLTALKALDIIGPVVSRRVLVTGASGGVGRFAVQLARLAGARVSAVSSSPERARALKELGAEEILHELTSEGEDFHGIVEGVGGATLSAAIQRVSAFGVIVSFASSDTSPVQFPTRAFFGRAPGACLRGLYLFAELQRERSGSRDLGRLAQLVAEGRLDCSIDRVGSWRQAAEAIQALLERRIAGKAVLLLD
jgi:NADPH:quinone reductase-like Zn-dependent oxidoreductase